MGNEVVAELDREEEMTPLGTVLYRAIQYDRRTPVSHAASHRHRM